MKNISTNRKAFHDYEILEKVETGIELRGTEVKSIRAGMINLQDSYAMANRGQLYIHHMHIGPYERGNRFNHEPYRTRKLLLHKKQIRYLTEEVEKKHLALVPLTVYFTKQWVKIELGLCKGRKKYDKRQKIAKEESKRQISKILKYSHR